MADSDSNDLETGEEVLRELPRSCPVCGAALAAVRKHDVTVDVCDDHGIWFDTGEFESVVKRLRSRRRPTRSELARARQSGKMSGALFGWWSFLGG